MRLWESKRIGGIILSPDNVSGTGKVVHQFIPSKKTMPPRKIYLRVTKSNSFEGMESLNRLPGALYRPHLLIQRDGTIYQYTFFDYNGLGEVADGIVLIDLIHPGVFEMHDDVFKTRNGLIPHSVEDHGDLIAHPTDEKLAYTMITDEQTEVLMHIRAAFNKHYNIAFPIQAYPDGESNLCTGIERNPYLATPKLMVD